jgi:hypothetical protein
VRTLSRSFLNLSANLSASIISGVLVEFLSVHTGAELWRMQERATQCCDLLCFHKILRKYIKTTISFYKHLSTTMQILKCLQSVVEDGENVYPFAQE